MGDPEVTVLSSGAMEQEQVLGEGIRGVLSQRNLSNIQVEIFRRQVFFPVVPPVFLRFALSNTLSPGTR